jgi:hypothetical protein
MITTRPKLSNCVVKLSQFATNLATIHYDAVYGIFQYLSGTHYDGFTYTRQNPLSRGSVVKHTPLRSQPTDRVDEHVPKRICMGSTCKLSTTFSALNLC